MPTDDQPRWRDEAGLTSWARERLDAVGLSPVGAPERQHAYPWATVLRWELPGGTYWLKAVAPGMSHEPALAAGLARWAPDHVLTPVAVEPSRGWLLLPDGGTTLRQRYGDQHDLGHWERLLPSYAQLQREVAPHVEEMLAFGVPDFRVERLLGHFDSAAAMDDEAMFVGAADGPAADEVARVRAAREQVAAWVEELAAYDVPVSVQHDDLHDANVFASVDGNLRVFDWGDATVAPVLTSLLIALRVARYRLELESGAPELLRLRDAYLEAWTDLLPIGDLRAATDLCLRLGPLSRAHCYDRATRDSPRAEVAELGEAIGYWFVRLLGPTPLDAPA